MRFFAEATNYLGVRLALLALVVFLVWRGGSHRRAGICALIAFPIADGLTNSLKHLFPMGRPCNLLPNVINHGVGCSASMGTASAHSANMAAIAFVFTYYLRGWGAPWIVIALITGVSRVYHGAHYPSQVAAGWFCGCLVALAVVSVEKAIRKKPADVSTAKSDESPTA